MSTAPSDLDHLADLTRRYGAWGPGGPQGGLPLAWGGLTLGLLVCGWTFATLVADRLLGAPAPGTWPSDPRALESLTRAYRFLDQARPLVAAMLCAAWALGKDPWRARLYQPLGTVAPALPSRTLGLQTLLRALVLLAALGCPLASLWKATGTAQTGSAPLEVALGLTLAWALPWVGWTRMRGIPEHLLWLSMALLVLLWTWLPLANTPFAAWVFLPAFLLSPGVIALGLVQHLRHRKLRQELPGLEGA